MRRFACALVLFALTTTWLGHAQQPPAAPAAPAAQKAPAKPEPVTLTIDSIMRGPKLIGNAPTGIRWSPDSSKIYFSWQKPGEERANTWVVNRDGTGLAQVATADVRKIVAGLSGRPDAERRRLLTTEGGNVVIYDLATGARHLLVKTSAAESSPRWARKGNAVTFMRDGNLFLLALDGRGDAPTEVQLTDVPSAGGASTPAAAASFGGRGGFGGSATTTQSGSAQSGGRGIDPSLTESQRLLREEEKTLLEYVRRQAEERQQGGRGGAGGRGGFGGSEAGPVEPPIARFTPSARQSVADMVLSADEQFVFVNVVERPELAARTQDVPQYVTESTYTEMTNGRTNVGDSQSRRLLAILDLKQNKVTWTDGSAFAPARILDWGLPDCSDDGARCVTSVRSQDNHDRWLVTIDPATGKATAIDTVHDDAWIREGSVASSVGGGFGGGGFGGGGVAWLPDNKRFLFMAEKDGWMHLYSLDASQPSPVAKQLTTGKWEVASARLSNDRTKVYFASSEVHPGERQFYTMSVDGGPSTRITTATGAHDVTVSPDEKTLAVVFSYTPKPAELFVMPFMPGAKPTQVTTTPTPEWLAFKWVDPKIMSYKARDGQMVYARLYTPEMVGAKRDPKHPAVVFVHGAGYLQFATKSWSASYYREHLFHHLLAARGYVVICPDYRASAGYGRDWRTGIYEHMGGKDLEDVVDAAKFLVATEKVNPKRIGVYGGSYGGFITLMAMFTTPDVFAAGAALRPVTDWAHYNHGYTAPILGLPQTNIAAYRRSSPIYFAGGLKGQLLICHGMVDSNVFFQDSVRLVQRLIELRKENWSIAPYPVENHSFTEETSWADEYKRILQLFETYLRK
jgi:dipeptidyl aminopeptidase/acylaminoacyl peptidase